MKFLYSLGIRSYSFLICIASLWNPKAKLWMEGRKSVWKQLDQWESNGKPAYWFHCASLGEFEQGRPLMEALKEKESCQLIVTFFSPSGYEIRKNYELADLVVYLPRENRKNVKRFLTVLNPSKVFFVKYEFWATYLFEAKKLGAAVYSVSAVFRADQIFFKPFGGFMRKVLKTFDHVFVQDKKSEDLLAKIGIEATLAGDTRYDRVMANAEKVRPYPEIEKFINGKKVLVVGSSWAQDDQVIKECLNDPDFEWKVIMAPHEIGEDRIKTIEATFEKRAIRYSNITSNEEAQILIIDNIGMLMNVYQYADIAYVGGAFGKGLHNILEPACFGVPVIFGDRFEKFTEAFDFIAHDVGYSVSTSTDFIKIFNELVGGDPSKRVIVFMKGRLGATAAILDLIK